MIKNINDLLVFLKIINNFRKGITEKSLFNLIQKKSLYPQWHIQTKELLNIGIKLRLFEMQGKFVILTQIGKDVLDIDPKSIDLNDKQRAYIVENCIFNNDYFADLVQFLMEFVFDIKHDARIYNILDYPRPKLHMELLDQLQIISRIGNICQLNSKYVEFVDESRLIHSNFKKKSQHISVSQLEKILEEQKIIGMEGEKLSMAYEKRRLEKMKLFQEANNLNQISLTDIGAGYDIASFNKKTPTLIHNYFIEIKARKQNIFSFIISDNEIQTAKKYGSRYAIYFWNSLGYKKPSEPTQIIIDPIKSLQIKECENCISYIVRLDKTVKKGRNIG